LRKTRKRKAVIYTVLILLALWIVSLLNPELAIRRYMLIRLQPVSAIISNITNTERYDNQYGYLYNATNYEDWSTGEALEVFYLKKIGPFWFVSSVGSGP